MEAKEEAVRLADNCGSPYPEIHSKEIELAMEEYAQIKAIAFSKWLGDILNPFIQIDSDKWAQSCGNSTVWTTEQLYNLFKEQK